MIDGGIFNRRSGNNDPAGSEAVRPRRPRNRGCKLPGILQVGGSQAVDHGSALQWGALVGCVVTGDHFVEVTCASAHDQMAIGRRLPGKSNSRSKVVPRRVVLYYIIDRIPIYACGKHAIVIGWRHESRQRATRSGGSGAERDTIDYASRSWIRYGIDQAGPDIREVTVFLYGPPIVFPAHSQVDRQSRINLVIVLNKSIAIVDAPLIRNTRSCGKCTAVTVRDAAGQCTIRVAGIRGAASREITGRSPDEEVRPPRKTRIAHRTPVVVGQVSYVNKFEARP